MINFQWQLLYLKWSNFITTNTIEAIVQQKSEPGGHRFHPLTFSTVWTT